MLFVISISATAKKVEKITAEKKSTNNLVIEANEGYNGDSYSLKENENRIMITLDSIKGVAGVLYDNGKTIQIPNTDMAVLRHTYKTEEHYSNRSDGIVDCISCSGRKGTKHYFDVFYTGVDGEVAPIFRLDYNYLANYVNVVRKISKELGYERDEFINSAQGNGKGVNRIRNIRRTNSSNANPLAGRKSDTHNGGLHSKKSRQRSENYEQLNFGISDGNRKQGELIPGEDLSHKDNIVVSEKETKRFLDTLERLKRGEVDPSDALSKYVDSGRISAKDYDNLIATGIKTI